MMHPCPFVFANGIDRVLFPAPMSAIQPTTNAIEPRRLGVQRDDQPRATTALLCPVAALLAWSDDVPGVQLQKLRAASMGKQLLVIGAALPLLPTGARFWGKRVLLPLGVRAEPELPESALIEAAGLANDELLLHHDDVWEAVPTVCLERVTRAGLKLLARGTP